MNDPTTRLTRRLDRLERENRWWRGFAILTLVVLSIVMLTGQVTPGNRVVEANRFILKDATGTVRAALGFSRDGSPGLTIVDKQGSPRIGLLVKGEDGWPSLGFTGRDGKPLVALVVEPDGSSSLGLSAKDASRGIVLGVRSNGETTIVRFSQGRNPRSLDGGYP